MKQSVQSDPNTLQAILQSISNSNPQLLNLINNNKQEFIRLLKEPISNTDMVNNIMNEYNKDNDDTPTNTIQLTSEELNSIDNLISMGFPREACLEA